MPEKKGRATMDVTQANARLPLVRAVIKDAMERWRELREVERKAGAIFSELDAEGDPGAKAALEELGREKERLDEELQGYVSELAELGAEVKDFDMGLVDFPAKVGARTVYLCWKAGEPEVRFWHEIDAGFAGRRPIGELK